MDKVVIFNQTLSGKVPDLKVDLLYCGFEDFPEKFIGNDGKPVSYSKGYFKYPDGDAVRDKFTVSIPFGHDLQRAKIGEVYECEFTVNKGSLKLIGLKEINN